MNKLGNKYALAALKNQRAKLAGEIVQLKKRLAWAERQLVHVDATLHLLDPLANPKAIPAVRPQQRIMLFRQGELSRLVIDTLRRAEKPTSAKDVVSALLAKGGFDESARPALAPRVCINLAYQVKVKRIRKIGHGRAALWALPALPLAQ